MKAVLVDLQFQLMKIFCLGAVLALAIGCNTRNEDEGDPEPEQGTYRVTLTPWEVEFRPQQLSAEVTLSATCVGVPECPNHAPMWRASRPEVRITDPTASTTVAAIVVPPSRADLNDFTGQSHWEAILFTPTQVPDKLRLVGRRRLDLKVTGPELASDRTDPPSNTARLIAVPRQVFMEARISQPASATFDIRYQGPEANVIAITLSGPGASRFRLSTPALPLPLERRSLFPITVAFLGSPDLDISEADVTVYTESLSERIEVEAETRP